MRNLVRIEKIINLVREIWYSNPDLRFTQLVMNVLGMSQDPYYVEDNDLIKSLIEYKKIYSITEE